MTQHREAEGGDLVLIAGSGNRQLAEDIAEDLGLALWPAEIARFPDGEAHVMVEATVRDRDVYLIQPTSPPVDENLVELLLLADACVRSGAARLTAVIPYFGYARQDRRTKGREAIGARVVSDLIGQVGIGRVIGLDLHSPSIEGFLSVPLEHLSAVATIAGSLRGPLARDAVVVAPDLGAAKLAERYGQILDAPVAIVQKTRLGPAQVSATRLIGDVAGRTPVIVDDMISTGGTIEAAAQVVIKAGARDEITVAATHGLLLGDCRSRFAALPIKRLIVTDSVPVKEAMPAVERVSVASLIAEAVLRIHRGQAMSSLLFRKA